MTELKSILEALLFAADRPLTAGDLKGLLAAAVDPTAESAVRTRRKTKLEDIEVALAQLAGEHDQAGRAFHLACVAGAWQFVTRPEFAPWLRALVGERMRPARLSQPALETLAIIAYRQPLTRAEIEQIRGVSVDGVMQTLLERGLVEQTGRAEVVGRPMQYGTTKLFLEYFGLRSMEDLPAADELRRIPVERPPSLITVEPGLATAPPEQLALPTPPATEPKTTGPALSIGADADAAPTAPPSQPAPSAPEGTDVAGPAEASPDTPNPDPAAPAE